MANAGISQNIFIVAVLVSAIPAFIAILAGWMRSPSTAVQRRGSVAILISIIALGVTFVLSAVGRAIEGSYLLAGAFTLGAILMVLAGLVSRTSLQIVNHRVATGETLELTPEQRRRSKLLLRAMTALVVVILALIIANIVVGILSVV
ncbi:hypothetical protein [Microbacterium sp. ZOR0019]|uniref:hypothetical protein n=1 Tax=Microbacterium sp. ZOR0019 TaxID=1339233 RepID=UPI000646C7E2|nr:hypothetical protein [Microbacterium sp. ZOR0019]